MVGEPNRFNLVIENLIFSTAITLIAAYTHTWFQSRNRESYLFKAVEAIPPHIPYSVVSIS